MTLKLEKVHQIKSFVYPFKHYVRMSGQNRDKESQIMESAILKLTTKKQKRIYHID